MSTGVGPDSGPFTQESVRRAEQQLRGAQEQLTEVLSLPVSGRIERVPNPIEQAALKSGWKTSEVQIVALVSAVMSLLVVFKWVEPGQGANVTTHILAIVQNIGPLTIVGGLVWHTLTSRGKIKSNAIKAQAVKETPPPQSLLTAGTPAEGRLAALEDELERTAPVEWVNRRLDSLDNNITVSSLALDKRLGILEQAVYGTPLPMDNQALPKPILDRFLALERAVARFTEGQK